MEQNEYCLSLELARFACKELLSLDLWSLCLQRTPKKNFSFAVSKNIRKFAPEN
jgi:hypothetical protein